MSVIVVGAGISGLSTSALLSKQGIGVQIFEKASSVGGRTTSMRYKGHILDNGFHIMPFYKTSAVYQILKDLQLLKKLKFVKVNQISFYHETFHKYPKGVIDILQMSLLPLRDRVKLLGILLPLAFSSYNKAEKLDSKSLSEIIPLDVKIKSFFDAVCMLAFADRPDNVSLGEFIRTMIRANPFRGGTSDFAYPEIGGYDSISKILAEYITRRGGVLHLSRTIKKIVIKENSVKGVISSDGKFHPSNCVVVSNPAYLAINQFFDKDVFEDKFVDKVNSLNKTTSVVEVHFCLSKKIDTRQIVFPVGDSYAAKGIFFISNITPHVSPKNEHLMMAGTPIPTEDADNPAKIRLVVDKMKRDISSIYPEFESNLLWERPMAWKLVESVVKEPGMVWKQKMPHVVSVPGLFFVGDSTISYGIGTDSAAHSSILCYPKIVEYLN